MSNETLSLPNPILIESIQPDVPIAGITGTVTVPSYTFLGDTDTGIYSSTLNFAAGGVPSLSVSPTAITTTVPITAAAGSDVAPAYAFSTDAETGMYSSGLSTLNFTAGGTSRVAVDATKLTSAVPIVSNSGSYGTPSFGFSPNLGFYAKDANTIEVASSNAGTGVDTQHLMRLSALGGWSQIRTTAGTSRPTVFIDQQNYGATLTAGYNMVSIGDGNSNIGNAWNHIFCWNTNGASFRVQGNGAVYADNAYSSAGADYAEYFESTDGTEIPTGSTVVLVDGKIRRATNTDPLTSIIGVVRPKNSSDVAAIGNVYEDYWSGKFEKDEFGATIMEEFTCYNWSADGKIVSYHSDRVPIGVVVPEDKQVVVSQRQKWAAGYDPDRYYISRSQRDEWHVIGLLGQIPVRTGEFVNSNWVLLGNVADGTVAKKYLVR